MEFELSASETLVMVEPRVQVRKVLTYPMVCCVSRLKRKLVVKSSTLSIHTRWPSGRCSRGTKSPGGMRYEREAMRYKTKVIYTLKCKRLKEKNQ